MEHEIEGRSLALVSPFFNTDKFFSQGLPFLILLIYIK